jgi:hypothetical protein
MMHALLHLNCLVARWRKQRPVLAFGLHPLCWGGLLLWASLALGADYSGTYKGDVASSSGKVENKLVLTTNGDKLSGTLTNQFGVLPLTEGHIDGQDLFFVVTVKEEGDPFRMVYRGHVFVDEIQFKIEAGERQIDLVAKKVQ